MSPLSGLGRRVLLAIAVCVLCWSAAASAQSGPESPAATPPSPAANNPVIENLRRNLPDNAVVSTAPGPVVTDAMTREEFLAAIEPVASFDWSQVPWGPGPAESSGRAPATAVSPDAVAEDLAKLAEDIKDGELALNAALPGPGTSVLGVPNSQTLVYGETTGQKFVANGDLQIATCYFDMYTSTPNATRSIRYGIAWSCNVPWIRGYIASGLGEPVYNPQGVRNIGEFSGNQPVYDGGWYSNKNYIADGDYYREREDQQVIQYGYVVLAIDGGRQGVDGFLTEPGGTGYAASRDCTGGIFQTTVACQFITGPYLWVPTDSTTCGTGDICGLVADATKEGQPVAVGADCGAAANPSIASSGPEGPATGDADSTSVDTPNPEAGAVDDAEVGVIDTIEVGGAPEAYDEVCGEPQASASSTLTIQDPLCRAYVEAPVEAFGGEVDATITYPGCAGSFKNKARTSRKGKACLQVLVVDIPRRPTWETLRASCREKTTRTTFSEFQLTPSRRCHGKTRRYRVRFEITITRVPLAADHRTGISPKEGVLLYC